MCIGNMCSYHDSAFHVAKKKKKRKQFLLTFFAKWPLRNEFKLYTWRASLEM